MVFGLFRRRAADPVPQAYVRLVQQARQPVFYLDLAVPDTVEGRFELIVLHCGLVVARLARAGDEHQDTARRLSEVFFDDMDRTLREMGTGDVSVPRKMKKIAGAFYGRIDAYEAGIKAGADDLAAALDRNVYDRAAPEGAAAALASYVRAAHTSLSDAPPEAFLDNSFIWPTPAAGRTS